MVDFKSLDIRCMSTEEVVSTFQPLVYRFAHNVSSKSGVSLKDATQSLVASLIYGLGVWRRQGTSSFYSYISMVLHNESYTLLDQYYKQPSTTSLQQPIDDASDESDVEIGIASKDTPDINECDLYYDLQRLLSQKAKSVLLCYVQPSREVVEHVISEANLSNRRPKILLRHVARHLGFHEDEVSQLREEIRRACQLILSE